MAHLTVSVLGEMQVLIDDVPIQSFESDKVRALLAYLVVEADRSHPREALIGLLWPDSPEEAARHNLRQALFNLRLVLGDHMAKPPYLLITRSEIRFNRESNYWLDLDQFNDAFYAWEKSRSRENVDPAMLVPQLEEMVKLYLGEFLQHFYIEDSTEFEDWIVVQRETSRQHVMDALTYLANEFERRGDFQTARRYASRQLELDPWREEAHYQIMRVLALDGQRSTALAQYETCKRVLAEELGVAPAPETTALYEQIRDLAVAVNKPVMAASQVEVEHSPSRMHTQPKPTGTVTFLFTDIEGSTKLWEGHSQAMQQAFARQEVILRAAMVAHHGYIYKMIGDAFQVAFSTAPEALAAALEAQMGLVSENWGEIGALKVRMALHTAVTEERSDDYVGPELNRVARLIGAGYGGQVLMNQSTYELVRTQLPNDVSLRDLGWHQLKDLIHPEHIYQMVAPGLPNDFPLLKTAQVQRINLPAQTTPFIGREAELAKLKQLLTDPDCRLLSLIGIGGSGKTSLALQIAHQCRNEFAHGVAFIPLASVESIETVIPAIANGIGFAFYGPADPKLQLLNYLREKQMLLVIDNVEHLLEEGNFQGTIAELLIELLQDTARLKLLITSREVLNLQGEWCFEVQGLSFPEVEQMEQWNEFDAVSLFVQRARRARAGFEMNAEDKIGILRVCRLVEGLPLAIELAASWTRILSPAEIATEIGQSLDFLNAQLRDLPERHRSVRAVFDYSWQMLPPEEKRVLGRLSVFRGGFQRQAAEQVGGASLSVLSSLVMRSLLRRTVAGRYDLHELIRQYAALKLAEDSDELHAAQERHSLYYLGLLEQKERKLFSHDQLEAKSELTSEIDNLRAAWDWSVNHKRFFRIYQVSFSMLYLLTMNDWFREGKATFGKTVEAIRASLQDAGPDELTLQIALYAMQAHYGYFLFRQGMNAEAYAILKPSAAFFRTSAETAAICYSHWDLGIACWILGKFSEAEESFQVCLEFARKRGEKLHEVLAVEFLGRIAQEQGAYEQALPYFRQALSAIRQLGDPSMTAHVLSYYGRLMESMGDYHEAEKLFRESLAFARKINYRFAIGLALDGLGKVAYSQGRHEEAQVFFSEGASLFREAGDHRLSRVLNHQGLNCLALGDLTGAKNAFNDALRMAHEGGLISIALHALTGLAALEVQREASQETLELIFYVLQHPASAQETKNLATRLRLEMESRLSQEEIYAAQQRMKSKVLDEFVRHHLVLGLTGDLKNR